MIHEDTRTDTKPNTRNCRIVSCCFVWFRGQCFSEGPVNFGSQFRKLNVCLFNVQRSHSNLPHIRLIRNIFQEFALHAPIPSGLDV